MITATAATTVDLSTVAGFRPYLHGATTGRPSAGRPLRVLAAINTGLRPETVLERFTREMTPGAAAPLVQQRGGGFPASRPCGTRAAYRRHKRHGEEACPACLEAENARPRKKAEAPAAAEPPPIPLAARCENCGYLLASSSHRIVCGDAA